MGGVAIGRSGLYHMLSNRLYLGQIVHKGERHPGRHAAIVDQPLFDQVQRKLASQAVAKGVEMGRADYVAARRGLEPPTSGLGNRCSILLSYRATRGGLAISGAVEKVFRGEEPFHARRNRRHLAMC